MTELEGTNHKSLITSHYRTMQLKKIIVYLGIFGALQFLVLTTYGMWIYPGGTIHERSLESYSFLTNYFSDLGRTKTFRGELNTTCHLLFKSTLTISGICIILFFSILPSFLEVSHRAPHQVVKNLGNKRVLR